MKYALILGGADCLQADREAALKLFTPDYIVATNEAGRDYAGELDVWVTMHPEKIQGWLKERAKAGRLPAKALWKPQHRNGPTGLEMRGIPSWGGSSGLLACAGVKLALECRGVLAGCPMTIEGSHYWDKNHRPWGEAPRYWDNWIRFYPQIRDCIRSMSGKTKELLGAPTREWLGK